MSLPASRQMQLLHSLPPELREGIVDLRPWGANQAALPVRALQGSLDWFGEQQLAVLGGDVWVDAGRGGYKISLDGWTVDAKRDESWPCYVERARTVAQSELSRIQTEYQDARIVIAPVAVSEDDYRGLKLQ